MLVRDGDTVVGTHRHARVSRFSWRRDGPWDRGDTPVTSGLWILTREEDSIDRSFTVLVRVIRRCLPAPPHRARWPVCWPCSGRALPLRHFLLSSGWLSVSLRRPAVERFVECSPAPGWIRCGSTAAHTDCSPTPAGPVT